MTGRAARPRPATPPGERGRGSASRRDPADRPLRVDLAGLRSRSPASARRLRVRRCVRAPGGPLSEGKLSGARLACPWHGWMYDVRTGQCTFPGRGAAVPSYPVRVENGRVWVELP